MSWERPRCRRISGVRRAVGATREDIRTLFLMESFAISILGGLLGVVLGLVISSNLFFLFVFWEPTSLTSFLLIGFKHKSPDARRAALKALEDDSASVRIAAARALAGLADPRALERLTAAISRIGCPAAASKKAKRHSAPTGPARHSARPPTKSPRREKERNPCRQPSALSGSKVRVRWPGLD